MTKLALSQRLAISFAFGLVGAIASYESSLAQITPDTTLGAESSVVTPNANIRGLPADLIEGGATRGANLFHSFDQFNVENGQRVYFANPAGIENILTRVTGNSLSNILGTLGVDGSANLFLLNPNGILFGENASLDVGGSFVGTTANAVQFGEQGFFSATNPAAPPLLTVNPSALWFNQVQSGSIVNNSTAPAGTSPTGIPLFGLRVPDGQSLLLVGGDIEMDRGSLNAPGGRIELGGLAEAGVIALEKTGNTFKLGFPSQSRRSNVTLANDARVSVRGSGGGDIIVNANLLSATNGGRLVAGTEGAGNGGDITVNATQVNLTGIGQSGLGAGFYNQKIENGTVTSNAGNITVNTESFSALAGAAIFSDVNSGVGNGGDIIINTGSLSFTEAELSASTFGQGDAGNIIINARDTVSFNGGVVFGTVESGAVGNGGDITINTGLLSLTNGAQLIADTEGLGDAGNIIINARDAVFFDGIDSNGFASAAFSDVDSGAVGSGGDIIINAESLSVSNGARLSTRTFGQGNAGNVRITTRDTVSFDNGYIFSTLHFGAVGRGGDITINTGSLSLTNGAQLITNAGGQGNAGNVQIIARDTVLLNGVDSNGLPSAIFSGVNSEAVGSGGDITINTRSLVVFNGSRLSTSTFGQGNAGSVFIQAQDKVSLSGNDTTIFSTVEAGAVGNGGNINISAGSFFLTDGAQLLTDLVSASSTLPGGRGNAGNVNIQVRDAVTIAGVNDYGYGLTQISSNVGSGAVGNGGNIDIRAGTVSLTNQALLFGTTFGQGNAGNISVQARDWVSLSDSSILSGVFQGAVGNGGNIDIQAGSLSLTDGASMAASNLGGQGDAGSVSVRVTDSVSFIGYLSGISTTTGSGGVGNSGNIDIQAGSLLLTDNALVLAGTSGQGNGGSISIQAINSVNLTNDSIIGSSVFAEGVGDGGNITIQAESLSLTNGAQLNSSTSGQGNAGRVTIEARDTIFLGGRRSDGSSGGILSLVDSRAVGNGGDITLQARSLFLTDGNLLTSSTEGQGIAGNISVRMIDSVTLANGSFVSSAVLFGGVGKGGNINVFAGSLFLSDGASLYARTEGQGNAGNIFVGANDSVSLANSSYITSSVGPGGVGNAGDVDIETRSLFAINGSQVQSSIFREFGNLPGGRGRGGNLRVNASDSINLSGVDRNGFSSGFLTLTERGASGQAGDITVNTGAFRIADGAAVSAQTFNPSDGGNITINTNTLEAVSGGQVLTSTRNGGRAGNITINATDSIILSGSYPNFADRLARFGGDEVISEGATSGVFASTRPNSTGNGGTITLRTNNLALSDRAQIASNSQGIGDAGRVEITATEAVTLTNSDITTSAERASGGAIAITTDFLSLNRGRITAATGTSGAQGAANITLQGLDLLLMGNESLISANALNQANGGNVAIDSTLLVATPPQGPHGSDITANASQGNGGRVSITSQGLFGIEFRPALTPDNDITVSSDFGLDGVFEQNTPGIDPSRGLAELPTDVVDASRQIDRRCSPDGAVRNSRFTVIGRGGLPSSPNETLQNEAVITNWVSLDSNQENNTPSASTTPSSSAPKHLVEAQGWVINEKGEVVLTDKAQTVTPHESGFPLLNCNAPPAKNTPPS